MRVDRSRPYRNVPTLVEEDDADAGVPDLRAKNPLRRPLSRTVKEIATLIGALTAISGYLLGGGRWLIKWADLARTADIAAAVAPLTASIKTSDEQRAADKTEFKAQMKAMLDEQRATAASVQEIKRVVKRLNHAPKDLP